ncbi:hypothetical protein ACFPRL_20355 [Pseudoclavibacter helvolus]
MERPSTRICRARHARRIARRLGRLRRRRRPSLRAQGHSTKRVSTWRSIEAPSELIYRRSSSNG